jgi:hypothetical protein
MLGKITLSKRGLIMEYKVTLIHGDDIEMDCIFDVEHGPDGDIWGWELRPENNDNLVGYQDNCSICADAESRFRRLEHRADLQFNNELRAGIENQAYHAEFGNRYECINAFNDDVYTIIFYSHYEKY